jgi:hypothetical protein
MTRLRIALAVLVVLLAASHAPAGPPKLNAFDPPAVRRGAENRLMAYGKELANAELLLPFPAEVKRESNGEGSAVFKVKPAARVAPGAYPVRLRTPEGISNLRLLAVTDLPVTRAKMPEGLFRGGKLQLDLAPRVEWPVVISGGRLEREIDAYRFTAKAGQRLVFVTETRRIGLTPDPMLRLIDPRGKTLASVHDSPGLRRDDRIDLTAPADGDYTLELRSVGAGGWNNHYLLKVGDFDYATSVLPLGGRRGETVRFRVTNRDGKVKDITAKVPTDPWSGYWSLPLPDHPGSLPWTLAAGEHPEVMEAERKDSEPQALEWPVTVNGRINKSGEEDLYRIRVKPGQQLRAWVEAYRLGSRLDAYLTAYDIAGKKVLAANDDLSYRANPDAGVTFDVPAGVTEVVLSVRDTLNAGGPEYGYRFTVEAGGPDFSLFFGKRQTPSGGEGDGWDRYDAADTLNLPAGGEAKLKLHVWRDPKQGFASNATPLYQGFDGEIRLSALELPRGVTVKPATIPAGATEGELSFVAGPDAPREPFEVVVVGEATRADKTTLRRGARRDIYIADPQSPILPWDWRAVRLTCLIVPPPAPKQP